MFVLAIDIYPAWTLLQEKYSQTIRQVQEQGQGCGILGVSGCVCVCVRVCVGRGEDVVDLHIHINFVICEQYFNL